MRLTQRLLVLLITISMLLSGSFVQTFAAEEVVDGGSVVASETAGSEEAEEPKKESGKEEKAEEPEVEETKEAAPEKEEPKAEAKTEDTDANAEPEEEAAAKDESEDDKELSAGTLTYECDDYTVTLDYSKNAGIPEGTTLKVREILADSNDKAEKKEYSEYHDEALDALKKESAEDIASLGFARFFDITLISDGKEIEPKGDVNVKIEFGKNARETVSKTEDAENKLRVVHITENEKTGELKAAALDKKDTELSLDKKELSEASFTTDSFSVYGIVYTVDFEYEGYAFSIKGESEILISELFEHLHIAEDASKVENVEFTDYELIKVEQTDGDWKLISLKPFDTEEKLTITLPEKIIEIKVTDAQSGNTFNLYREEDANEVFRTELYSSRAGVTREKVGGSDAERINQDAYGWVSFDTILEKYYSDYAHTEENNYRYSVVSAKDTGTNTSLCAIGFQESRYSGVFHGTFGSFSRNDNANGSATAYDLDITVIDNSLPVEIYVDGESVGDDLIFLSDTNGDHYPQEIAAALGHSGYSVGSSTINNTQVDSVNRSVLGGQTLSGNSFSRNPIVIRLWYGVVYVRYDLEGFNCEYPNAYKWTYGNNNNVGNTSYVIKLETPIARVSNDRGRTWTYHSRLIGSGMQDATTKIGAFDQANSLSGDVIVEMLYDTHERYTLDSGFTFTNANITSLTINGTGNKTTLVKDQTSAPMITTSNKNNPIKKVEFNNIIFNGNDKVTTNGNGGAVSTDAVTLNVNNCDFNKCQAGYQGGGIYHNNTAGTVKINKSTFTGCRANGPDDNKGGGGGGIFTNAKTLTVENNSKFDSCTTKVRQGAGVFHKRENETEASLTKVTGCEFNNCVSVWSGGGIESDARNVIVENTEFIGCRATSPSGGKGGAINAWANGEANTKKESSLIVSGCTFGGEEDGAGCTAQENGGAIRSTAINTTIENSTFTNCSAAKSGGAVACNNENGEVESTIVITGCSFSDCTAAQNGGAYYCLDKNNKSNTTIDETSEHKTVINGCSAATGGAIWSGILTMNAGTISDCSASANGGAIHGAAAITMNGGTISSCSTAGNGGAIDEKTDIIVNGGTISNCNAAKGGAIYSSKTITMSGGEVTGCITSGDSAAVDAVQDKPGIFLEGNVVIKDNKGSAGEARDVYLGIDSDRHIQINENGLGNNANIGIYAAEGAAFNKHGKPGLLFARTGTGNNDGTGGYPAAQMRNLDKLFSDRLDNGPMHGAAAIEGSGDNWQYRVMWSTETPVAPTGYNSKYIPFLLILAGGAVLIMLKKTADRRRSEDDTDEE